MMYLLRIYDVLGTLQCLGVYSEKNKFLSPCGSDSLPYTHWLNVGKSTLFCDLFLDLERHNTIVIVPNHDFLQR